MNEEEIRSFETARTVAGEDVDGEMMERWEEEGHGPRPVPFREMTTREG
jgi:hypothetical protein